MKRCSVVLGILSLTTGVRAQPATTIHTETKVVLVDVTVTDKKGNTVSGLMQKDFRLWEDNKEQAISSVYQQAEAAKSNGQKRNLVLFFDDATIGVRDRGRVREAAARLIQQNSGPQGLVALLNFSGNLEILQNFTADTQRLNDIIGAMNFAPRASGAAELLQGARPISSPMVQPPDTPASMLPGGSAGLASRDLILALRNLARNMDRIPGRKAVVLFTGGVPVNSTLMPELKAALEVCNRSNVTLYPVDLRGLEGINAPGARRNAGDVAANAAALNSPVDDEFSASTFPGSPADRHSRRTTLTNRQIMDMLADGTGGSVITNAADPFAGLAKISREQSDYYVLAYTPAANEDKDCHTLRVKVERSGLLLRARNGYCNARSGNPLAGKPIEKELETRVSGAEPGSWRASVEAPFFYTGSNLARVYVALDMDPAPLQFEKQKGKMHAAVDLLGIANGVDGSAGARFSETFNIDLADQKEVDKLRQKPIRYETQFEITPGDYRLSLAFSSGGAGFGKLEVPLAIAPHEENQFALSSLALSKEVHRASEAEAEIEAALLEDKTPLIAKDLEVVPSGSNVFRQGEPAMFYFEIYEPRLANPDPQQPVLVGIQIRVLDRQTGAQRSDSGLMRLDISANSGKPVISQALRLPVQALPPGAYTLELTAADNADHSAKRTVDFSVK